MSGIDPMTLLKGICLASGAAMHVAPLPTMREIKATRSTLNFHVAPYASTLLNHLVNLWYAIIRSDGPLIIHRICGITAQAYYLTTYLRYSPPHKYADNKKWVTWVGGILLGIFIWLHVLLPLASATATTYNNHIALFGAITGIGLAASPLATVGEVLRTKNASSLPFHLCAMVTLQCFSWMVYGYLRDDLSTFSNNLVGVILGSSQLTLIFMYGSTRLPPTSSSSSIGLGSNNSSGGNVNSNTAIASSVEATLQQQQQSQGGGGRKVVSMMQDSSSSSLMGSDGGVLGAGVGLLLTSNNNNSSSSGSVVISRRGSGNQILGDDTLSQGTSIASGSSSSSSSSAAASYDIESAGLLGSSSIGIGANTILNDNSSVHHHHHDGSGNSQSFNERKAHST